MVFGNPKPSGGYMERKSNLKHALEHLTLRLYCSEYRERFLTPLIKELSELEQLAELGEATIKAFGFSECDDYLGQVNKSHDGKFNITGEVFGSIQDLLDWAKEV